MYWALLTEYFFAIDHVQQADSEGSEKPRYIVVLEGKLNQSPNFVTCCRVRVKRIQGTKGIWEGSITMKYRFAFELVDDEVIFRSIGTLDILKRE